MSRHWSVGFQNPYYHLYFVEARAYNDSLKKKLTEWTKDMKEKHYHYLIVCIPSPSSVKKSTLLQKSYVIDKVFDAIKKDFGSEDRVVRLTQQENLKTLQSSDLNDIVYKIADEVMHEFVKRKKRIDREIKRFEETRNIPGWNFSHYFMVKENSAVNFQMIGLVRAALNVYNEAAKLRRNENITIPIYIKSQQLNTIFECNAKIFRTMLYDSSITEFEFQNYYFARMVNLMIRQSTPEEAAELALEFIPNATSTLKTHLEDKFFIYCWTYCTTMQIVDECKKNAFETLSLEKYFRTLGDLYSYAKYALKLAKKYYVETMSKKSPQEQNLISIITSGKDYERLIIEISSAASTGYSSGKRPRFLAKNNNEIAELRILDGKYEETINLLRNHLSTYMKEGWDVLAVDVLRKMAKCQREQNQIGEFISSTISLIVRDSAVNNDHFLEAIKKLGNISRIEVLAKLFGAKFSTPIIKGRLGSTISFQVKYTSKLSISLDAISFHFTSGDQEFIVSCEKVDMSSSCVLNLTKRVDQIGDLNLTKMVYRYAKLEFVELVKNGMNLQLVDYPPEVGVSMKQDAFVVGRKQTMNFVLELKGMLKAGRLDITSPTNLEIFDKNLVLEPLDNQTIPVVVNVLENGMVNTKHEITLSFHLEGFGKVPVKWTKTFLVDFYMPFTMASTIKLFDQRAFIQYRLKCNTPFPISIIKTSFDFQVNIVVEPSEFVFLSASVGAIDRRHLLMILTKVGTQFLSYKMDQTWNVPEVSFSVNVIVPDEVLVVGNTYEFEYHLENLGDSKKVICEVFGRDWMIQGTVKREIQLEKGQIHCEKCKFIPLSCGNVSIPVVKLIGFEKNEMIVKNKKQRVLILPEDEVSIGGCINFVPTTVQ